MAQYPYFPNYPTFNGMNGYPQPMMNNYTGYGQNGNYNQMSNQMQMQTQPQMTLPTIHADIIQTEEDQARDYNIAAGTTQMFMTKDDSNIFIKTAYANGNYDFVKYVKVTDKVPVEQSNHSDQNDYVTREEFEKRLAEVAYRPKYNNKSKRYNDRDDGEERNDG